MYDSFPSASNHMKQRGSTFSLLSGFFPVILHLFICAFLFPHTIACAAVHSLCIVVHAEPYINMSPRCFFPGEEKRKRKRGEWREEERKTSSHCRFPTANVPYYVIYHTQLQTKVGSDAKDECNTIMYRAMVAQVSPPSHLRYAILRLESLDRTCKHPKIDIGAVAVAAVGRWAYGGELRIIRNQISTPVFFSFSPNLNGVLCFQILMYAVH